MSRDREAARQARNERKRKARQAGVAFAMAVMRAVALGIEQPNPDDFVIDGIPPRELSDAELSRLWERTHRPPGLNR